MTFSRLYDYSTMLREGDDDVENSEKIVNFLKMGVEIQYMPLWNHFFKLNPQMGYYTRKTNT